MSETNATSNAAIHQWLTLFLLGFILLHLVLYTALRSPLLAFAINKDHVIWQVLDDEATLVHVETKFYYGLNATGTFVWNMLTAQEATFDQIVDAVSAEYEVEPAAVTPDIKQLLADLKHEQLIIER
jgi:hypothetical protein